MASHGAAPQGPAGTAGTPRGRKLSPEEIDKSVERLTRVRHDVPELKPLVTPRTLTKNQEDASVTRLYDNAIKISARRRADLEKRHGPQQPTPRKMDSDEMHDTVSRLYDQSVQRKKISHDRLQSKYLKPLRTSKLTAGDQEAAVERLYSKSRSQTAEAQKKLYAKYVTSAHPASGRMTRAEVEESANRLSSVKRR